MKKSILAVAMLFSISVFSQCEIIGKSTIGVGEKENYSISNDNAQCTDCHLWVAVGGNSQFDSDTKKSSVTLKPITAGRTILSLSVLTSQGLSQCSKNVDIVDRSSAVNSSSQPAQQPIDCDINISGYKEVKYADGITTFFPSNTQNDYKYTWTAIYNNGTEKSSSEKIPQFPYSKENEITKVKIKIVSTKCMKEFSKTYDATFWRYF